MPPRGCPLFSPSGADQMAEDPELPGAADGLAAVGHRQLALDALEMALDGVDRDEQQGGELARVKHLGRVLENLTLTAAERLEHDRCRARTWLRGWFRGRAHQVRL